MEGGSIALSPAAVGGRRHMKKVSAKTIKRTLRKLGMKPKGRVVLKGGNEGTDGAAPPPPPPPTDDAMKAGRRHRKTHKKSRKHRGFRLF
jgi:hypothetical protein